MRIVQLLSGDCLSADDCIGATLRIKGYIMHPCTVSDGDTGEQKDAIRTILVQDDGEPVAFVSRTIIDQIQRLAYIRDDQAPWDPPIVARLRQKSHGANRVYILVPESE